MILRVLALVLTMALLMTDARAASPQEILKLYDAKTYTDASGKSLLYRLFKPANYDPNQQYPLVLFLHGAGGRGDDNQGQILDAGPRNAAMWALPEYQAKYPCFILAPQCPRDKKWVDMDWSAAKGTQKPEPTDDLRMTYEVIGQLEKEFSIDKDGLYVTGLSMGGFGTWDIITRHPGMFAAAVPVCGGGDEATAEKIKDLPIWCFHGGADGVVKTERSRNMIAAIKQAGGEPKYTEYPGVGHDSWNKAYTDPELLPWLFGQNRKGR
jgi:predicted peptidase